MSGDPRIGPAFRAQLVHDLPADKDRAPAQLRVFAQRAKAMLVELAEISLECARLVVATDEHGAAVLPAWFMIDIGRDLADAENPIRACRAACSYS